MGDEKEKEVYGRGFSNYRASFKITSVRTRVQSSNDLKGKRKEKPRKTMGVMGIFSR